MKDFLSEEEWPEIVAEAAPDYQPPDGQALGLRTVHIFAIANILHRPIILLDSLAGMLIAKSNVVLYYNYCIL